MFAPLWQQTRHFVHSLRRGGVNGRPARRRWRPQVESLESRCVLATAYLVADLVSDQPGVAPIQDPHLINGWGIALGPTSPFWVSSEGADLSVIYQGDVGTTALSKNVLEVAVPGGPTGLVFNGTSDFAVAPGMPARFIFATESGTVMGWNSGPTAQQVFQATDDAIYTGIALGSVGTANFLYLADFHNNQIDVLSSSFQPTTLPGTFTDPTLPAGYAPFNVAAIGTKILVAYAQQDAAAEEEVTGAHLGFVNVFDTSGNFQQRLISQGELNAPWAMVQAPAGFGDFSGALLVGNFGDGRINAYNSTTGAFLGTLSQSPGHPIEIDGLWGLTFGNGANGGSTTTLYFAAGPDDETHGLFGKITANPAGTSPVQATLDANGTLLILGSPGDDHVNVRLDKKSQQIIVQAGNQQIGAFDAAMVSTIQFMGLAGDDHINVNPHVTATAILDGGAGNDFLNGGWGNSVLLGGPGDDHLLGSKGRDLMIGGTGRDHLNAQQNDDILIGGSTTHDANSAALLQILAELTSLDSFSVRIDKLRGGMGGLPMLSATTVTDDAARDIIHGGPGLDWFWAGVSDQLPGKHKTEQVN